MGPRCTTGGDAVTRPEPAMAPMARSELPFDPRTYAPVADRVALFWERHPGGRIVTELVERSEKAVVFRALVFRSADDREPAATGWACEEPGSTEVNAVACLENTETSAVGRALANLGFLAARQRPSLEEMARADGRKETAPPRARPAGAHGARPSAAPLDGHPPPPAMRGPVREIATHQARRVREPVPDLAGIARDVARLLDTARRLGVRPARIERWRRLLDGGLWTSAQLRRAHDALRTWTLARGH